MSAKIDILVVIALVKNIKLGKQSLQNKSYYERVVKGHIMIISTTMEIKDKCNERR